MHLLKALSFVKHVDYTRYPRFSQAVFLKYIGLPLCIARFYYPRLTRTHTPDASEEVRVIPFPPCGENSIMLSPSSFFLTNPLRWALLGVCEVSRAFRLDGLRHICVSKVKNHTKIHRCQVQSSFGEAEKRPDDEKAAGNTLCIGKAFEDVWAFFLPVKTVCVLVNRG